MSPGSYAHASPLPGNPLGRAWAAPPPHASYVSADGIAHLQRLHMAYQQRTDGALRRAERQIATLWSAVGGVALVVLMLLMLGL